MISRDLLIDQLLTLATDGLARSGAECRLNTLACRFIGEVALLTGHKREAQLCRNLLNQAPIELFLLNHRLAVGNESECETRYPTWSNIQTRDYILNQNSPRYAQISAGEQRSVLEGVSDAYTREDSLIVIAVFGGLEESLVLAEEFLTDDDSRRSNLRFVVTCESLFQERLDITQRLIERYTRPEISAWTLGHIALAVANRRPWDPYPFPDY